MAHIVVTHRGETKETVAVKAVLEYYGNTVEERVVSFNELLPLTRGMARVLFEFRGTTYYSIDKFLGDLSNRGFIHM